MTFEVAGYQKSGTYALTDAQRAAIGSEKPCKCGWHPILVTTSEQAWPWLWDCHIRDVRKRGIH